MYDAFAAMRPYNAEKFRFNLGGSRDTFAERLTDDFDVDLAEYPDIDDAITQAYELLQSAAANVTTYYIVGNTRPAGLLAELPDKAAEFVADWEA